MSDDDALLSDEELSAELAAIDASRRDDGPAALRSLAGRPDLLALMRAYHHQVDARRAVVAALLDDAALPRRLAAIDHWYFQRRDPPPGRPFLIDPEGRRVHWAIQRSALMTRVKRAATASREKASGGLYFGPWRGFSPLP